MDRVVQRIAARQPTVLVVDDLQWAEVSSLDALAYLIAGFQGQTLALVVTIREEDRARRQGRGSRPGAPTWTELTRRPADRGSKTAASRLRLLHSGPAGSLDPWTTDEGT